MLSRWHKKTDGSGPNARCHQFIRQTSVPIAESSCDRTDVRFSIVHPGMKAYSTMPNASAAVQPFSQLVVPKAPL